MAGFPRWDPIDGQANSGGTTGHENSAQGWLLPAFQAGQQNDWVGGQYRIQLLVGSTVIAEANGTRAAVTPFSDVTIALVGQWGRS